MPTVYALLPEPTRAFLDSNGDPASGYQLFIYTAGSSTKATTYTESDGNTANSNPVVLNSRGEPPGGIYVESGTYKLVLATDTDTDPPSSAIWTRDNVSPINDTSTTVDQFVSSGLTPTFVNSTSFTLVGDQRSTFHIGRRLKTSNSGGTGYHSITNSTFSSPNTTVTLANDSTALDAGLSSVSLSILTADDTSSLPGATVSEDDWAIQGTLTVGGSSVATTVTTTRGDLIRRGASADERVALGANGFVMTSDGTDAVWAVGKQAQTATLATYSNTSAAIPVDDTIPQSSEGTELLTVSITPYSATSTLLIDFQCIATLSGAGTMVFALFQDSTADALQVIGHQTATATPQQISLQFVMTSGTTSSTTFKIRYGSNASAIYVNGNTSSRLFGGVAFTTLSVREV